MKNILRARCAEERCKVLTRGRGVVLNGRVEERRGRRQPRLRLSIVGDVQLFFFCSFTFSLCVYAFCCAWW